MAVSSFPWLDWLNEQPEVGFYSALQDQGGSPGLQRYFQGQYGNIYNQYLGALGSQVRGGGEPTLKFTDFLAQNPFTERYAQLPPELRGNQSAFAPFTQWRV